MFCLSLYFHQMTPLHVAAVNARNKIVNYLIEHEADIKIQDHNGVNLCD